MKRSGQKRDDEEAIKPSATSADIAKFIDRIHTEYEKIFRANEMCFWDFAMNKKNANADEMTRLKNEFEAYVGNPELLNQTVAYLEDPAASPEQRRILKAMENMFKSYIIRDPAAKAVKEELNQLESELGTARSQMKLGYVDPKTGQLVECTSMQLGAKCRTDPDEKIRKACYEGIRSIGDFIAERFAKIVKLRNQFARMQGYIDFYDYQVMQIEGISKEQLFKILDELEAKTRDIQTAARAQLAQNSKVESALKPWNFGFSLTGKIMATMAPYTPFSEALDRWGRSYAALGINYRGSIMRLDLLDRFGKFAVPFCHWNQSAWRKPNGEWVPSECDFASLASPNQLGSGDAAMQALMHEAGHAAHHANIDQPSPFFSEGYSVSYSETQSMLLESLRFDAAWLGRYCCDKEGNVIPWETLEKVMRNLHPFRVFFLRAMIAVPYFEKALYELSDDQLTAENVLKLADDTELKIRGGPSGRPILAVPHILEQSSSAYYHGYVLAYIAAHQTRQHFLAKYGSIVDNPQVGKDMAEIYWKPGSSGKFFDLVEKMTGKPLSTDAWVNLIKEPVDSFIDREQKAYAEAVKAKAKFPPRSKDVDLGMRVQLVDGDRMLADTEVDGGFGGICEKFAQYLETLPK